MAEAKKTRGSMVSHLTDRRYAHSRALLGDGLFNKVANAKLLVVGQVAPQSPIRSQRQPS